MKTMKLAIEHQHMGKTLKKVLLEPTTEPVILGSGKTAAIRLLGPEVGLVHAALEHREDGWHYADLGSATGSWHGNDAIVEKKLDEEATIRIGNHSLKITPISLGRELFSEKHTKASGAGGNKYHQIVIKRDGHILESHILSPEAHYETFFMGKKVVLTPPESSKPKVSEYGQIKVIQRIVEGLPTAESEKLQLDPTFKWASLGASGILVLLLMIIVLAPKAPEDELDLPDLEKNKYSRMIFDAKITREKQAAAKKIVRKRMERKGA